MWLRFFIISKVKDRTTTLTQHSFIAAKPYISPVVRNHREGSSAHHTLKISSVWALGITVSGPDEQLAEAGEEVVINSEGRP